MNEKCACCKETIGELPFIVDASGGKICYYCECNLLANYSADEEVAFWNFVNQGSEYDRAA